MSKRIPIHGSMSRPGDPTEGLDEMKSGRIPWAGGNGLTVEINTEEFTSVCPTTGQPDFGEIQITYCPHRFYLESKTVKYYLMAYRNHGAHCETLADKICRDVVDAIQPINCTVRVTQKPRGGLGIVSTSVFNPK